MGQTGNRTSQIAALVKYFTVSVLSIYNTNDCGYYTCGILSASWGSNCYVDAFDQPALPSPTSELLHQIFDRVIRLQSTFVEGVRSTSGFVVEFPKEYAVGQNQQPTATEVTASNPYGEPG